MKWTGRIEKGPKKRNNTKEVDRALELHRMGCTCDLSPGYFGTDPRCPLHGINADPHGPDRR